MIMSRQVVVSSAYWRPVNECGKDIERSGIPGIPGRAHLSTSPKGMMSGMRVSSNVLETGRDDDDDESESLNSPSILNLHSDRVKETRVRVSVDIVTHFSKGAYDSCDSGRILISNPQQCDGTLNQVD